MLSKTDAMFSKTLVEKGLVSAEALKPYVDEASKSKEGLLPVLLKAGAFSEDELLKNLSECLKIPFATLHQLQTEAAVIEKVPLKTAEYYKMVPRRLDKKKLTVAVSSPLDLKTQDDIRAQLGFEVTPPPLLMSGRHPICLWQIVAPKEAVEKVNRVGAIKEVVG